VPGGVLVLFAYAGTGRALLAALKYRNGRSLVPWLAVSMARLQAGRSVDVVTWAPTHPGRRRQRGYDQAEILARALARSLGVPCRRLLRRTDRARPQTTLGRAERLVAPAFAALGPAPGHIVVVDDVVTTGATLAAAAAALRASGASVVTCMAAAATPSEPLAGPPTLVAANRPGEKG
jgi:predicted amidophosphoribosyltransferase